ncbi:MAG: hypothetical protein Aurels2KO_50990 [Aureliella sp.]
MPRSNHPNTRFSYMYRDGANYKTSAMEIVSGRLSFEEIRPFLDRGEFFIASQLGLSDPQEDVSLSPEYDHVYVEIQDCGIEPTDEMPTIPLTSTQLLENFRRAHADGWDIESALARTNIPVSRQAFNRLLDLAKAKGVEIPEDL